MRLKSLHIKGFKSFADETVIHFNESVTGIVGPNGSGKSNIVDAIRWVLGEQKGRELRLEQMSDVIFNGTKKRKEAPLAHVSLHFENTKNLLPIEFQNVEISRYLYRSGDSEYRLNGVSCRLKDITGLFLDTGIGSDSYAIIALNMVEELLSNKESARRKMFEQAAGISKYKTRKRETLNKLKSTKEDLSRIEDLLFEINNNLVELEKQAKRTKKFNDLRERYKAAGLLVQYLSVKTIKEKLSGIEKSIEDENSKVITEEASVNTLEAQIEALKKANLDQEKNLSEFQKKVNDILDVIRSLESIIEIDAQKKIYQTNQLELLEKNIENAASKIESLTMEVERVLADLETTKNELESASRTVIEQEVIYNEKQTAFNQLKSGLDKYQIEKQKIESQIFDCEKEIAINNNQIESLGTDSDRCEQEMGAKSQELINLESQHEQITDRLNSLSGELNNLLTNEEQRLADLKSAQSRVESATEKVSSVYRLRDAKKNEYELLKSMVEKMEGFPESIKFLHQNWRQDIPVLLDLIYTDEKYRSGIELFLENYLNYYVVNNENDAIKAIRLLFSNSKGKANFFILDKFRNSVSSQREIPACVSALSVIEVSNLYQPLFNDLLKDVYILDKEEHLEDVIQFPDDISIISLSGSIIKSNKIITGGSIGLFEGKKLGRKKNLEKLEIEIKNLEGQTIELERQLSEQKNVLRSIELTEKTKEIEGLRKSESELLQHRAQIKAKLQHLLDSRSELENRIKINVSRIEEIKSRMVITSGNILELKTKQAELQNSLTNSDEEYNVLSVELSEASNVYHQAKLELLKWQNKLDNIQKELDYKNGQLNEIRAQLDSDYQKCDQLKDSIQLLSQSIEKNQDELLEKLDFRKNMDVNLSAIEQEYYEMRNSIAEFEARVKSHQKNIYDYQSIINQIKETKAEYKFRIQSAQEIARIEFSMDLEHFVPDEKELEVELDSLEEKTRYYKTRIDNYGEVNPLALEAYEEMKGRLEKIEEQRNDILKAQDSLLETIKEIEDTATAGFLEAFNQVRHHFQAVFRSLFTEDDDCDLILVDESDPLECDIDIIAKPKGKRPKSISQLSGGEKTLTAIALLFSLYLLKPAPFCIFDEVDAPLDDINIEKFNKIIRKFAKDSQFIIITHNKLTMADVDVLYGVYMEEQGLSSVTAVDLRKYEHEVILEEMAN